MKKTFWKSNINFVKDVPMIYVNLIIIVSIVSEKNRRPHVFTAHRTIVMVKGDYFAKHLWAFGICDGYIA